MDMMVATPARLQGRTGHRMGWKTGLQVAGVATVAAAAAAAGGGGGAAAAAAAAAAVAAAADAGSGSGAGGAGGGGGGAGGGGAGGGWERDPLGWVGLQARQDQETGSEAPRWQGSGAADRIALA